MAREARDGRSIGCASAASRTKITCATTDFPLTSSSPVNRYEISSMRRSVMIYSAPNPLVAAKACLLQAAFVDINMRKSRSVYY
jgi:hypothetical protein